MKYTRTKPSEIVGTRCGRLVVESFAFIRNKATYWNCRCDCGRIKIVKRARLWGKRPTLSCGCLWNEQFVGSTATHRMSGTPTYKTWAAMIARCCNKKSPGYRLYGGRGIKICKRWRLSFTDFLADVGPRPTLSHSIDRIDYQGNYEPGNVRWANSFQQANNTRRNRYITAFGNTHTLQEWSRIYGVGRRTIAARLKRGWQAEKAVAHGRK